MKHGPDGRIPSTKLTVSRQKQDESLQEPNKLATEATDSGAFKDESTHMGPRRSETRRT